MLIYFDETVLYLNDYKIWNSNPSSVTNSVLLSSSLNLPKSVYKKGYKKILFL